MTIPSWLDGCPGRSGGIGRYQAEMPSLSGWHRYNRDGNVPGDTRCEICGEPPPRAVREAVWAFLMDAEAERAELARQRAAFSRTRVTTSGRKKFGW